MSLKASHKAGTEVLLFVDFISLKGYEKVIDLGTGDGIIPILLARKYPRVEITGIEIQKELVDTAIENVRCNNLQDRVLINHFDIREVSQVCSSATFDVVISNPPYYPLQDGRLNPAISRAISRHEVFCTLSDIFTSAAFLLKQKGKFVMIQIPQRLEEIIIGAKGRGLIVKKIQFVHPERNRNAIFLLVEALKGGREGIEILPPLYIMD